jgi:hypothetical protein
MKIYMAQYPTICRELTQERICVTPTTVGPFMCLVLIFDTNESNEAIIAVL